MPKSAHKEISIEFEGGPHTEFEAGLDKILGARNHLGSGCCMFGKAWRDTQYETDKTDTTSLVTKIKDLGKKLKIKGLTVNVHTDEDFG